MGTVRGALSPHEWNIKSRLNTGTRGATSWGAHTTWRRVSFERGRERRCHKATRAGRHSTTRATLRGMRSNGEHAPSHFRLRLRASAGPSPRGEGHTAGAAGRWQTTGQRRASVGNWEQQRQLAAAGSCRRAAVGRLSSRAVFDCAKQQGSSRELAG